MDGTNSVVQVVEAVRPAVAQLMVGRTSYDNYLRPFTVKWVASYSLLGPYDYLDIFEAPDERLASQAALIVRSFGHATTETWTAIPWNRFLGLVKELS
ncbi:MAG: GYD domain-containing protein [Dehalococcoidia bacterium]|nr:GYD domain-containing protein [Dehalococcoidia bacterium]